MASESPVPFGYKISWLAVHDRSPQTVADALRLSQRADMAWSPGIELAYEEGLYVTPPVSGWTLVPSFRQLPAANDRVFVGWLERLSLELGEVQYFGTHRVVDYHAWARARDGKLWRAYCFIGDRGEIPLVVGESTAEEIELAIGTVPQSEDDDDWWENTPSEEDVLELADRWSVDPTAIEDGMTTTDLGIFGRLSSPAPE